MAETTPLMRQYQHIKDRYPQAILFFRLGDFYEMFSEDAVLASKILGITLTTRDRNKENPIPMCGVPYHSANGYVAKLIRAGHNVAICEQMEDPQTGKGIVRRDVVRVVTPGTLLEEDLLNQDENNFIAAISVGSQSFGLSFLDLSTGYFRLTQFEGTQARFGLENELGRLNPSEILISETALSDIQSLIPNLPSSVCVNRRKETHFGLDQSYRRLLAHFKVHSLDGFGCQGFPFGVSAAGSLLQYLQEICLPSLNHIRGLNVFHPDAHMILDPLTQRNLELVRSLMEGKKENSLLGVLDFTLTAMGARTLRNWVLHPLVEIEEIQKRQEVVEEFVNELLLRHGVRKALGDISDMERLISRISLELGNARDLVALKTSLKKLPDLYQILQEAKAPLLRSFLKNWDSLETLALCIDKAIQESPPVSVKDGGLIRDGFHEGLDELRLVSREGKNWIAQMEREERKRTGIESLKVRYNQVFGYYIEVTQSHLSKVPSDFIRKQTLVNAERFFTPKLKELEEKVLGAEEKIQALELELFQDIRQKVVQETSRVQTMAQVVAQVDVLSSLAEAANRNQYVKPVMNPERVIDISDGRHPVLEQFISDRCFIPNDSFLDGEGHRLLIITGPNMAGKSTYMRQVALIAIMAQMGSFVPAKSATIGIVDRIFTRVGASDNLVAGQSTFMIEMNETANILNNATPRSLIILDEVGRGTSTFDGLSIAWAVAEHILNAPNLGARTLFATHYHELMDLAVTHSGVQNYNSLVREWNEEIIFLRKIKAGGSDKSYGIQVARLAGLPQTVIQRAKEILENLEKGEIQFQGRLHQKQKNEETLSPQKNLFSDGRDTFDRESLSCLMEAFQQIDVLKMTPLQALNKLDELKKIAETAYPYEQKEVK